MNKWDKRGMELAKQISNWSKDPSTQVGAVIMDMKHRVVATGFNGYARGVKDCEDEKKNREIRLLKTIHAETNAIVFSKTDLTDCTMYVYPFHPCTACAALIIQSGIKRVVTMTPPGQGSKWEEDQRLAGYMLSQASVAVSFTG